CSTSPRCSISSAKPWNRWRRRRTCGSTTRTSPNGAAPRPCGIPTARGSSMPKPSSGRIPRSRRNWHDARGGSAHRQGGRRNHPPLEFLHFQNRWHKMWGRLATCGRLAIGRLTLVRIFPPNTHILFVPTFRSRRLPHYHSVGQATFFTWRLHGSLPQSRSFPSAIVSGRAFLARDRVLDTACTGPLFLRMPEIAKMVMDAIHYRDQRTY